MAIQGKCSAELCASCRVIHHQLHLDHLASCDPTSSAATQCQEACAYNELTLRSSERACFLGPFNTRSPNYRELAISDGDLKHFRFVFGFALESMWLSMKSMTVNSLKHNKNSHINPGWLHGAALCHCWEARCNVA